MKTFEQVSSTKGSQRDWIRLFKEKLFFAGRNSVAGANFSQRLTERLARAGFHGIKTALNAANGIPRD